MLFFKKFFSNDIIKNILSMGAATLVSAALAFIVGIVTRNMLGPEQYGYWLTVSLLFTMIPLFQLGIINAMNREVPFYKARNDLQRVREIKNLALSFTFTLPLIIVLILFFISLFSFFTDIPIEYKTGLLFSSILAMLMFLTSYVEMFYKSEQDFKNASKLIGIKSITQSLLTVIFVYLWGYHGLFIGMGISIIIQLIFGKASFEGFEFTFDIQKFKELIKVGFPILLVGMVWSLLIASDRIIISVFMTPEDLGNYGVGMLIFNSMMLLPQVIGQVFYPKIVELVSKEEFKEIYKLYWKLNSVLALVILIIVSLLYMMFPWFVETFMPEFVGGIKTGQILILGIYPLTLMGFAANYFNSTQKQKIYISIQISTIVINLFLTLLLLKLNFSITSIALGTSFSYLIYSILMNYSFILQLKERIDR